MNEVKKTRRQLTGVVVSDKMEQTIVVRTERIVRHKLYGKMIRRHTKYLAHDPENTCRIGDKVIIEECRPLSKRKRWRLREIAEKAA